MNIYTIEDLSFETLFENHLDLLAIFDKNGNVLKRNKAWEVILGYNQAELNNSNFLNSITHPDDKAIILQIMAKLFNKEVHEVLDITTRYKHKNNSYKYIKWDAHFKDDVLYIIAKDISIFFEKQRALLKDKNSLMAIFEAQTLYILHVDMNFTYSYTNSKFLEDFAWNYTAESIIGVPYLFHEVDLQDLEQKANECIANPGISRQALFKMKNRDNEIKDILFDVVCIVNAKNEPVDFQCIGIDITDKKFLKELEHLKIEADFLEKSTPITQIWDNILLLPLIGHISSKRANNIINNIVEAIEKKAAKICIVDISGVEIIDQETANYFIQLSKATQLMGCQLVMSGISPKVAMNIIELNINLDDFTSTGSMKKALEKGFLENGLIISSLKKLV